MSRSHHGGFLSMLSAGSIIDSRNPSTFGSVFTHHSDSRYFYQKKFASSRMTNPSTWYGYFLRYSSTSPGRSLVSDTPVLS